MTVYFNLTPKTLTFKKSKVSMNDSNHFASSSGKRLYTIRINDGAEPTNQVKRRGKVVGTFPDGESALMLVCARLKYIADTSWGERRYLNMSTLEDIEKIG